MKCVLTIAGSDCSGGAGIQADIKTMQANGVYAMSAVTALTAQNTTGVYGIMEASPEFLEKQLDCVFSDIFPDAVKIGMVSSAPLIGVIADSLKKWKARNIVADPVMVATSGSRLLEPEAQDALVTKLLPLDECGHAIDDGDTCLYEVPRVFPCCGIYRNTVYIPFITGCRITCTIPALAKPVHDAA